MGDDLLDLPVLRARRLLGGAGRCGARGARARCTGSARSGGGRGAVRECIEHVLRAQGRWRSAVADYLES